MATIATRPRSMTSKEVAMNNCSHLKGLMVRMKMMKTTMVTTYLLRSLPRQPQLETVVNSARMPRPNSMIVISARLPGKASFTPAKVRR